MSYHNSARSPRMTMEDHYGHHQGGPPPPPPPPSGTKRGRDGKEKESFKCPHPDCGQEYSRMEYLKRHQRKHEDVRPFVCKDCDKSFARSDVLLRHRRRCHPTPPPEFRASPSPGASRAYPSVPVSSSRNDSRELSPPRNRRKRPANRHPRVVIEDQHPPPRGLSEEEEEDAFALAQQMRASGSGSGRGGRVEPEAEAGMYDIGGDYYNMGESSTYTPHLLPMFQNQHQVSQRINPNGRPNIDDADPNTNHLEDASVLLSMAYPGGVPGDGSNKRPAGNGGREGDWHGHPSSGDAELGESVGNFLNSMGWLGSTPNEEKDSNEGDPRRWVSAAASTPALNDAIDPSLIGDQIPTIPRQTPFLAPPPPPPPQIQNLFPEPLSIMKPFSPSNSLSALLSPSFFGFPPLPALTNNSDDSSPGDRFEEIDTQSAAVQEVLDQLARYDAPQTRTANPDPERPLIRIEHSMLLEKAGKMPIDPSSPFYLDPKRFTNCYEVAHWRMPPMRVLSLMAAKTYHTVLNHFSFIHQPTFKLHDTAACLAFAICTVGGIRSSSHSAQGYGSLLSMGGAGGRNGDVRMDGPVVPQESWESMYVKNYSDSSKGSGNGAIASGRSDWSPGQSTGSPEEINELQEEKRLVEEWQGGHLVRNDKTNMLVKSFSQAKGVLMTDYNCALLQALVLYHAPYYLSENEQERSMANMFLGTIVNITRQIGFLTSELEHFSTDIGLPREPYTPNDLNFAWRRWIQLETRRRTAYLIYHLDTVSALESNIPCILTACEFSDMPLPAPDTLWKAPTAEAWAEAAKSYRSMTLDEAMRRIFFLPSYGSFDTLHASADTKYYNLLNEQVFGPFARVAMVLSIVRGVMDIGEGKRDRGDWRDLTDLWIACSWLKPGRTILDGEGREVGEVTREGIRERFALALDRWREGWDFDPLCSKQGAGSTPPSGAGRPAKETLMYCEEALPFYWLAQALLSILNSSPQQSAAHNAFRGLKYGEMLKSARTFTRLGEGAGAASAAASAAASSAEPSSTTSSTPGFGGFPTPATYAGQGGFGQGGGIRVLGGLEQGAADMANGNGSIISGLGGVNGQIGMNGQGMMSGLEGMDLDILGGLELPAWV